MMMDTSTPRKRKAVKTRRLMVEFRLEGQQPHRMQGADPQRHDACGEGRDGTLTLCLLSQARSTHHCPFDACKSAPSPPVQHPANVTHLTLKPEKEAP